jgi:hypothetical protein
MAVGTGNPVPLPSPYHMTFRLMKNNREEYSWTFSINPQSYSFSDPVNTQILQTLAGGYADVLGRSIPLITIQGTTAQRLHSDHNGGVVDGITALQNFKHKVFNAFVDNQFLDKNNRYELRFYNWTLKQYYSVVFANNGVTLSQSVSQPVWWFYEISLACLNPLPAPADMQVSAGSGTIPPPPAHGVKRVDTLDARYSVNAVQTSITLANTLMQAAANLEGLIAGTNISELPTTIQQLLNNQPVIPLPGQALTIANFPGISLYTGILGQTNNSSTILGLLNDTVFSLVGAIQAGSSTGVIPYPYSTLADIISEWKALNSTIEAAYSTPPTQLLYYVGQVIQALSGLAALTSVYVPPATLSAV